MNMRSYVCCSKDITEISEVEKLTGLLKIISDHNRLQIVCILQNGEHCVCQLMEHVKLSQSLISHHLKDLKDYGLVSDRKDSKWSYYSLTNKGKEITNLIFRINI
jgi:ArsR family transcriptional regulator